MKVEALRKEYQNGFCMLSCLSSFMPRAHANQKLSSPSGSYKTRQHRSLSQVGRRLGVSSLLVLGPDIEHWYF